jgi:hypothetical protein
MPGPLWRKARLWIVPDGCLLGKILTFKKKLLCPLYNGHGLNVKCKYQNAK